MKTVLYGVITLFFFLCAALSVQYYVLGRELRHLSNTRQQYIQHHCSLSNRAATTFSELSEKKKHH